MTSNQNNARWLPIEIAPKDGTWIIGYSISDTSLYRISYGCNHRGELAWCSVGGSFFPGYITHWMPLPELTEVDKIRNEMKVPVAPVDRSAVELACGKPVTDDHREIDPETGQQKDYIVLTAEERAKGFVRPYRDAYRHLKCGKITTMSRAIAETYAVDPWFYSGTFCSRCRAHFPIGEAGLFTWCEMDGREGPKVGT